MVSPWCLPRAPKIQNTGEAQRGSPILQALHEMQAPAVAAGDNSQISRGCNSRENQDVRIEHPVSNRSSVLHDSLSTYNLSYVSVGSFIIDILMPPQNRPVIPAP